MAVEPRISDVIEMYIDWSKKNPVIEMQFQFLKYRLHIDNKERAEELATLLIRAAEPESKVQENPGKLPRFYRNQGSQKP
jgi:hypothetical protein